MRFYEDRTVREQMGLLPVELQEYYKKTQLDRIKIDGEELYGYFEYSFLEEKSYREQPIRSDSGVIENLESYATFLTPRLIIKYNMMHIDDYRKLMKLLKSKNEFTVECYDIVEDKRVTHRMYFAPPQMPIIYQQYLMALGIQEYSIELIGTNNDSTKITYDFNIPDTVSVAFNTFYNNVERTKEANANYNAKTTIGKFTLTDMYGTEREISQALSLLNPSYEFAEWNTAKDGSGRSYKDGEMYYVTQLTLYAIWEPA